MDRLKQLLADRTTGRNIMWATDEYESLGGWKYLPGDEMTLEAVTGPRSGVIRPRVAKAADLQASRTKGKAEVYTPSWVCNTMVNNLDEAFFGRRDAFNVESEDSRSWTMTQQDVSFDGAAGTWRDYVGLLMLEITCGEAPFVCSRYDATTGDMIPVPERFGILDRKLRVVTENVATEAEWLKWAKKALRSTYAYEYQGDSLLIARINVFLTMAEWMRFRWSRWPDAKEASYFAHVISWNVWQMDGLTDCVPAVGSASIGNTGQMSLFEDDIAKSSGISCRICDWNDKKRKVVFSSLKKKEGPA